MGQILKDIKWRESAGAVSDFGADEMYLTFAPAGLSGFRKKTNVTRRRSPSLQSPVRTSIITPGR